jgi:hypothetical protein
MLDVNVITAYSLLWQVHCYKYQFLASCFNYTYILSSLIFFKLVGHEGHAGTYGVETEAPRSH